MRTAALSLVLLFAWSACAHGATRDHDITVDDYFSLAYVFAPAWSPDGKRVAFVDLRWDADTRKRNGDIWVADASTGRARRLTFDPAFDGHPSWSPDGQWVYFQSARESGKKKAPRNGKMQVWRIGVDGRGLEPVTRLGSGIQGFELGTDGSTLFYTTGSKQVAKPWRSLKRRFDGLTYGHGVTTHSTLWALDLRTWRSRTLAAPGRAIRSFAVTTGGRRIAMITTPTDELITNEGWSRVEVLDRHTDQTQVLPDTLWRKQGPSPYGWLDALSWSADGEALAFTVAFDGYPAELLVARFDAAGKPTIAQLKRPGEVSLSSGARPQWRGASKDLLFVAEDRARAHVFAIPGAATPKPGAGYAVTRGDLVISEIVLSRDGKRLAAATTTPTHFGDLFVGTPQKASALKQLTRQNSHTASWKLPTMEVFRWKSADGTDVEGILELPPGHDPKKGPLPTVVMLHGGPTAAAKMRLRFWGYGRVFLPAKGYALLMPNYRGSTGYGDEFLRELIGRKNDVDVTDVLTGVDALVKKGVADPQRLAVMGWSNGGYLTNCVITKTNRFKAASSGAGVVDVAMQWAIEDTPGHVVNYQKGLPWEQVETMRKASPLYDAGKIRTPTLIHVGENDPRCPPAHSRALHRAMHHYLKKAVELVVYPGAGHSLREWRHKKAKMEWDLAWFEKYVLGK